MGCIIYYLLLEYPQLQIVTIVGIDKFHIIGIIDSSIKGTVCGTTGENSLEKPRRNSHEENPLKETSRENSLVSPRESHTHIPKVEYIFVLQFWRHLYYSL